MSKDLIAKGIDGFLADKDGVARVDSKAVADAFGKEHKNVLQSIRQIISDESGYSYYFPSKPYTNQERSGII